MGFDHGDNSRKGKSRGKSDVPGKLDGLGGTGGRVGSADWGAADSKWIHGVIVAVTKHGGLVSFGMSRDQGAYNLTILLDGDRRVIWVSSSEDIDLKLEQVYEFFNTLG